MIPPILDFSSDLFDSYEALHSNKVHLPYPKAKIFNNVAEYFSQTFLKKGNDSNKLLKIEEKPRERNYDWYYDTLGLSENQRNYIQRTKKVRKRKGKKPVSVVTIPSSPLKSERVTVCKSYFKNYCRRKYRSLNTASALLSTGIKTEPDSTSVSPFITEVCLAASSNSNETEHPSLSFHNIKSESLTASNVIKPELPSSFVVKTEPHESPTASHVLKSELPSSFVMKTKPPELPIASHVIKSELVKTEPLDSSDDSFQDDILILKMKTNVQKGYTLKTVYESPVSYQIKQEPLWAKNKNVYFSLKYLQNPHLTANNKELSKISCSSNVSSSTLNENNHRASLNKQKKDRKKHKKCSNDELILQNNITPEHKKQKPDQNKDNSNLPVDQSQKSSATKENNSDSISSIKPRKKPKKSALKSQENKLDEKQLSTATDRKSNILSKIKTENSEMNNHCTCNFPCGLSHLCTCGYFANAKEALSKFKIPRKKK